MTTQEKTYDLIIRGKDYQKEILTHATIDYCYYYIQKNNQSSWSFFRDHQGDMIEVVCRETKQVIEEYFIW
jgi:hypothetical protein